MPEYQVGDRVDRIEDREITGATVISIQRIDDNNISVELQYDEGGSGWWPVSAIKPINT
jgi:hypothetical protein